MMRHIADGAENIYVALGYTDFRKQQKGLVSLVALKLKLNLDPYKYLEYIFRQLPNVDFTQDNSVLDEYLPWSEEVQLKFRMQNAGRENKKGEQQNETA